MKLTFGTIPRRPLLSGVFCALIVMATLGAQTFEVNVATNWTGRSQAGGAPASAPASTPASPQQRQSLTVFVLVGQQAVNSIPDRRGTAPIVEVRDQNSLPVEGADVVFTLPASGPGGVFANGQRTTTVRTNIDGQAVAPFFVNRETGSFEIHVAATYRGQTGSTVITQSNSGRTSEHIAKNAHRPWYRTWKLWAVVGGGGAAAAAAILATRGGSSSSATTITITPGSASVGHP